MIVDESCKVLLGKYGHSIRLLLSGDVSATFEVVCVSLGMSSGNW